MKKSLRVSFIICLCFIVCICVYVLFHYQKTSAVRPVNQYDAVIDRIQSSIDKDGDGIDDQSDILQGALAYVATEPKYKSKYYTSGYPDDGYGVCTDVVAYALKWAGYDLMELVSRDIAKNPDDYPIEQPDILIDFRRVKNLKIFFANTAIGLTTEVASIEEWQGGDIVVFENHIGIVSDRRNRNGVPYVIHHNGPMQTAYEQDILESRSDIVGHYRMSE